MKGLFVFIFLIVSFFGFYMHTVFAQEKSVLPSVSSSNLIATFIADAGGDRNAIVNRAILFIADQSVVLSGTSVQYRWNFGDGTVKDGVTVSHTYGTTGVYRVRLTVSDNNGQQSGDEIIVTVTKDIIALIADSTVSLDSIARLQSYASSQGILIVSIHNQQTGSGPIIQGELTRLIKESNTDIRQSKIIIFWTEGSLGFNAFIEAYQLDGDAQRFFKNKIFVQIAESRFSSIYRSFQNVITLFKPLYLIIVSSEGLNHIVNSVDAEYIIRQLQDSGIEYQLLGIHSQRNIDTLRFTNFLSYGLNYLVHQGVPLNNLYMILIIPVIATIIAFFRQIIGIKTFGIYTPTIITLAFLSIGIWYGLLFFTIIMVVGTIFRLVGKRLRFFYIPRMAILLSIISLTIIVTYLIGIYYGSVRLINVSILPILLLAILAENFISAQMEKGTNSAIKLTYFTLIVSIFSYFFVGWSWFRELLLGYPELIILTILLNIFLGRWSGLRVLEYHRFHKLFS